MGLSSGDAMAFCGPAAAMAFAETFGRNPTVDEAKQLASQVGWNPDQGMAGPSSEVSLLNKLGIDTHMSNGVDWSQVASEASSGNPVIIDAPGHYFYVDGYNAQTGQYHLGTSATDLKAAQGQQWFTPDQIPSLGMGDPRAAIYADHPLSASDSVATNSPQSNSITSLLNNGSQAASAVGQQAQDTMSAVLNAGSTDAQDLASNASNWLDSQKSKLSDTLQSAGSGAQDLLSQAGQGAQDLVSAAQQQGQDLSSFIQQAPDAAAQVVQQAASTADQAASDPLSQVAAMGPQAQALLSQVGGGTQDVLAQIQQLGPNALSLLSQASQGIGTTAQNVQQGASSAGQTAQDLLSQAGTELTSPNLPSDVYQRSPTAWFNNQLSSLGPSLGASNLSDLMNAPMGAREAAGSALQDASTGNTPVLSGAAGVLSSLLQQPDLLNSMQTLSDLSQKYAGTPGSTSIPMRGQDPLGLGVDPSQMTPADQQAYTRAMVAVGGLEQPESPAIHSGNEAAAVYNAAAQSNIAPATGAAVLQRTLDSLSAYPEEVSGPIRQFASSIEAPASEIANTVQRWIQQNPLEAMPSVTAPTSAVREVGQQAVADIADAVTSGRGRGIGGNAGYLPPGTMPGQLGLLPDQPFQPHIPQAAASGEDLLSQVQAGELRSNYQPQQTLGTYQMPLARPGADAGTSVDDFLNALYQNPTPAQRLPGGVSQDMVNAAHAYIDTVPGAGAGTPHTDLNTLLRNNATPDQLERFFAGLEGRTLSWSDVAHQARTGSMVGGLSTTGKVALGPIIQTAMRAPAGALDLVLRGRAGDIPLGLQGGLDGLAQGAQDALQTMRYGTNYRAVLSRGESGAYGFKPGLDVIGSTPAQRAAGTVLGGLARTHGAFADISAGIGRGANAALGATPEQATEAGQQWAFRSGQYGSTGGGMAGAMARLKAANPAVNVMTQLVLPFYRVGYNVFTQGVENSPVGFAGRVIDAAQGRPLNSAALSHNLFGTGLAVAAFTQAAQGNITGDRPQGGAPKQSMRVPGVGWVPLRTIGPASEPLAQAAALYESARDNKGDTKGMAIQLGSEYLSHVTDETWLSSMADAFGALTSAINYSNPTLRPQAQRELGYVGGQYAKSLIPQEKLGEQALGLLNKSRATPTPTPTPGAIRPAPTIRPAPAPRAAPTPRPAAASR